ncbi:hypothetical protein [Oerskovia turbata]
MSAPTPDMDLLDVLAAMPDPTPPLNIRPVPHPETATPHYAWCVANGHPPLTHNSWENATWCACGAVITPGSPSTPEIVANRRALSIHRGWITPEETP